LALRTSSCVGVADLELRWRCGPQPSYSCVGVADLSRVALALALRTSIALESCVGVGDACISNNDIY